MTATMLPARQCEWRAKTRFDVDRYDGGTARLPPMKVRTVGVSHDTARHIFF